MRAANADDAPPDEADMKKTGFDSTPELCNAPSHGVIMAVGERQRIRRKTSVIRNRLEVVSGISQLGN
jgi:hypothetical protein